VTVFHVEIPDDLADGGPGLCNVTEIMEMIRATFDPVPSARTAPSGPKANSEGVGDTLGPRAAEILRQFSVQSEVHLRFLDADTADAEFSVRYRTQSAQSFVGRVARHGDRWLISPEALRLMLQRAGIELPPEA
jgi:hypothetical protein